MGLEAGGLEMLSNYTRILRFRTSIPYHCILNIDFFANPRRYAAHGKCAARTAAYSARRRARCVLRRVESTVTASA
jgi:hypothetical protein